MKIRNNYVSNSSSSSFILAFDKDFFGNMREFFISHSFGFETSIMNPDDMLEYLNDAKALKSQIRKSTKNGKDILCISIANEYESTIELLEYINQVNGGDKMEIIYDGRD